MYACMYVFMYVWNIRAALLDVPALYKVYLCMHACMYACMYACMCVCMYEMFAKLLWTCQHCIRYIYVCMYACMYVCDSIVGMCGHEREIIFFITLKNKVCHLWWLVFACGHEALAQLLLTCQHCTRYMYVCTYGYVCIYVCVSCVCMRGRRTNVIHLYAHTYVYIHTCANILAYFRDAGRCRKSEHAYTHT